MYNILIVLGKYACLSTKKGMNRDRRKTWVPFWGEKLTSHPRGGGYDTVTLVISFLF